MEMSTPYLDEAQLVNKIGKPVEHSLRCNEDWVKSMKWMKPCSVILDVLQEKQNFKVRCLIHNRYECRCINRSRRRHIKCLFCSGCSVQNKLTKWKKKNYRCPTKQSDISQQNETEEMKSLSGVNKQFSIENSADRNICADETSSTVQEISNGSTSKTLNSHDFSGKPEEHCAGYQCNKFSTIFVDVENDLVRNDYLFEEDEDICKVNSENLFAGHKDIDYHLVKSVKVEQDVKGSNREIDINVQNLDAPIFIINDICTSSDSPGLAINQIHSKIKEEIDNYEEVSIINESIISIELNPLSKIESLQDISENIIPLLDERSSDELPDKRNEASGTKNIFIVHKPLKVSEAVQREKGANLQLQNEAQTLDWTLQSDLKIKPETNSRVGEEEYVNKLCMADEKPFGCTICGEAFKEQSSFTNHKRIHTREKQFCCTICGKMFTRLGSYTKHKRIHTGEKPFGCPICGKAFTQDTHLIKHKRVHTGEKPFGCTICGKTFTDESYVMKHKRIHTGEKPFCCTICRKVFTMQSYLTRHKRTHTGQKPFGCTICGKTFAEQSTLKTHKRIHTGEKPFGCTICKKAFTEQSSFTKHKRIHTGEKPFGCTICGKTFTEQSNLTNHKRVHTGEKPFGCIICGKVFTQLSSLIKHKRIHTGEKPFGCPICGKAFTRHDHLTKHKCVHTGEKPFDWTISEKACKEIAHL